MKRYFILLLVAGLVLSACHKEDERVQGGVETFDSVYIEFTPYQMEPMKANSAVSAVATRLDVYMTDGEDTLRWHQQSTDAGFGTLSATINLNHTYRLVATAHGYDDTAAFDWVRFIYPEGKMKQVLVADTTFSPADGLQLQVVMQRVVGRFMLRVADEVPVNVAAFRFTVDSSYRAWNLGGYAEQQVRYENTVTGLTRGSDGYLSLNTYIMADDLSATSTVDILCEALDANGTPVEVRQLAGVPIKDGYVTSYTGTFFITWDMGFSFVVGDWGNVGDFPL